MIAWVNETKHSSIVRVQNHLMAKDCGDSPFISTNECCSTQPNYIYYSFAMFSFCFCFRLFFSSLPFWAIHFPIRHGALSSGKSAHFSLVYTMCPQNQLRAMFICFVLETKHSFCLPSFQCMQRNARRQLEIVLADRHHGIPMPTYWRATLSFPKFLRNK